MAERKGTSPYFKHKLEVCGVILAWVIVSICSVYPDLMIKFDPTFFTIATSENLLIRFLIPFILFLGAFVLDFLITVKEAGSMMAYVGTVKWLLGLFVLLFFIMVLFYVALIKEWCFAITLILFILIWVVIASIKALSLMWSKNNYVELQKPIIP